MEVMSISTSCEAACVAAPDPAIKKRRPGRPAKYAGCQVCGISVDGGRLFHKRYHICQEHMMALTVERDGRPQRFCQQCARFHDLAAFDPGLRSCRAQLARHAERRRKAKPAPPRSGGGGCVARRTKGRAAAPAAAAKAAAEREEAPESCTDCSAALVQPSQLSILPWEAPRAMQKHPQPAAVSPGRQGVPEPDLHSRSSGSAQTTQQEGQRQQERQAGQEGQGQLVALLAAAEEQQEAQQQQGEQQQERRPTRQEQKEKRNHPGQQEEKEQQQPCKRQRSNLEAEQQQQQQHSGMPAPVVPVRPCALVQPVANVPPPLPMAARSSLPGSGTTHASLSSLPAWQPKRESGTAFSRPPATLAELVGHLKEGGSGAQPGQLLCLLQQLGSLRAAAAAVTLPPLQAPPTVAAEPQPVTLPALLVQLGLAPPAGLHLGQQQQQQVSGLVQQLAACLQQPLHAAPARDAVPLL